MRFVKNAVVVLISAVFGLTMLGGCAADGGVLAKFALEDVDGRTFVNDLEAVGLEDRTGDYIASVRADHVLIIDAETEEEGAIPLPEDEFYLSVAPYVTRTHPCGFHSLTTCVGELFNADFDVTVVDDTGAVLVDETVTSEDSGFFGLWLPAGVEGEITVQHDGLSVTGPLSTHPDAKTCETDLQLT